MGSLAHQAYPAMLRMDRPSATALHRALLHKKDVSCARRVRPDRQDRMAYRVNQDRQANLDRLV